MTVAPLGEAIDHARDLALRRASTQEAANACGTSGFVLHSVSFATFGLLRYGSDPLLALTEVISAGGDTDSTAAIMGAWLGALHGEAALPRALIDKIHDGPFGPSHFRDACQMPGKRPRRRIGYCAALLGLRGVWRGTCFCIP